VLQGLNDDRPGGTRTITFSSLTGGAGCSSLSGKFQVTSLTATSRHSAADGGIDGTFTDANFATAKLFYIGTLMATQPGLGAGGMLGTGHPSATHWQLQLYNV